MMLPNQQVEVTMFAAGVGTLESLKTEQLIEQQNYIVAHKNT